MIIKTSSNVRGTFDGWHGDEYEVELTWDEKYELACQEADLQNDEDWINEQYISD